VTTEQTGEINAENEEEEGQQTRREQSATSPDHLMHITDQCHHTDTRHHTCTTDDTTAAMTMANGVPCHSIPLTHFTRRCVNTSPSHLNLPLIIRLSTTDDSFSPRGAWQVWPPRWPPPHHQASKCSPNSLH
jgi:hypothetical protein